MINDISKFEAWVLATRPKTLPAAAGPVLVGSATAAVSGFFDLAPALAALTCAFLLQIAVNLANDYFDGLSGVDGEERLGPVRVTQSGLIPPGEVKKGIVLTLLLALVTGFYLIYMAGIPVLLIGAASIAGALCYSGGPYPLASNGLGDLFVFIFFGLVAVCGTFYVQAKVITLLPFIMAVPVGTVITAIMVVNNLRDIDTDSVAGKVTLAVKLGRKATKAEYIILLVITYIIPVVWGVISGNYIAGLLPLLSVPFAVNPLKTVLYVKGPALNEALAETAKLSLAFCILLSAGIIISVKGIPFL